MSRRDHVAQRCDHCRMYEGLCICSLVPNPPLSLVTKIVLVIHRLEMRKPTNTGQLAVSCLANCEVVERGHDGVPSTEIVAAPGTTLALLFPHEHARPISPSDGPLTLVVPDGSWRQAAKVRGRVPGLRQVPCVTLPPGPPSRYRLRHEAHETGLATMEAIARALGVLEGEAVQQTLEQLFDVMVERTLWLRGDLPADQVKGGIPPGAVRS